MARPARAAEGSEIGSRLSAALKSARRMRGLSLDAVARLSGVSRSMVSQIERGVSSPTVATLWNLTQALQIDFAGLIEGQVARSIAVVHAAAAPTITGHSPEVLIRILSGPEMVGVHEIYDISFGPGAALVSQPHRVGCRENLVVTEGSVAVTSGEDRAEVGPHDAATYAADRPHSVRAGPGGARVLMIVRNS